MIKKILYYSSIVLLNVFLITSCSTEKAVRNEKVIPADRLIRKLEGNRRTIKTFYGKGVLNIRSKSFKGKTSFEISVKKPDSIKISIYGPFGIDLAHGLITKRNFLFYDVLKNRAYTGTNNDKVLKSIFKIDLTFNELIDAFAGAVNLTDKLRTEPDIYITDGDTYQLLYLDEKNNKKSRYEINKDDLAIINYSVSTMLNDELFEGDYSKFQEFEKVPIPFNSTIINKVKNESLSIEYKSVEVNEKIESLAIKLPSDVKIIKW
ncbi:MAG: DUF4292 domain-containing protein [Chlorobi bacterium]|nr:DUF4292 domain-containing protein [Chlorobiota bacterium]